MTEPTPPVPIADLIAAIEQTSSDIAFMDSQIVALEAANYRLDEENSQLRFELSEAVKITEAAIEVSKVAARGADLAEANVQAHQNHADQLEADLQTTVDDLAQIACAVSGLQRQAA